MELDNSTAEVQNENTSSKRGLGVMVASGLMIVGAAAGFFFLGKKRGVKAGRNEGANREEVDALRERLDSLQEMVKAHSGTANESQA